MQLPDPGVTHQLNYVTKKKKKKIKGSAAVKGNGRKNDASFQGRFSLHAFDRSIPCKHITCHNWAMRTTGWSRVNGCSNSVTCWQCPFSFCTDMWPLCIQCSHVPLWVPPVSMQASRLAPWIPFPGIRSLDSLWGGFPELHWAGI